MRLKKSIIRKERQTCTGMGKGLSPQGLFLRTVPMDANGLPKK